VRNSLLRREGPMLKQRVITAVVLLLALMGALLAGHTAFAIAMALLIGAAAYEWSKLAGLGEGLAFGSGLALGGLLLVAEVLTDWPRGGVVTAIVGVSSAVWLLIGPMLLRAEQVGVRLGRGVKIVLGAGLLTAAWVAAMALYRDGLVMLFSTAAIVWVADIAAYFAGRAFGKRKLAPHISPGKTWAGVVGAVSVVLALALLLYAVAPQLDLFSTWLIKKVATGAALVLLALLVALSIVGDLFESLLKRQAGVKDSSRLLPGHGGVLDRIDALLPMLPAAVLLKQVAA
jgi:phosphatidate cytidylyltransferase